jgi:hypothetical protein
MADRRLGWPTGGQGARRPADPPGSDRPEFIARSFGGVRRTAANAFRQNFFAPADGCPWASDAYIRDTTRVLRVS